MALFEVTKIGIVSYEYTISAPDQKTALEIASESTEVDLRLIKISGPNDFNQTHISIKSLTDPDLYQNIIDDCIQETIESIKWTSPETFTTIGFHIDHPIYDDLLMYYTENIARLLTEHLFPCRLDVEVADDNTQQYDIVCKDNDTQYWKVIRKENK